MKLQIEGDRLKINLTFLEKLLALQFNYALRFLWLTLSKFQPKNPLLDCTTECLELRFLAYLRQAPITAIAAKNFGM